MLSPTQLEEAGLVAIVRAESSHGVLEAARALKRGGLRAVEITLNTPDALALIAALRQESQHDTPPLLIGAGTILDADDARRAIEAGAQFLVTPTLQPDSIAVAREWGAPIFCGALTPTECLAAHRAGADFVKLFPAAGLGPSYVRALLGPLPFLKLVPTGGVSLETLASWLQAGCRAVAAGSELVSNAELRAGDWDALEEKARRWAQVLGAARAGNDG